MVWLRLAGLLVAGSFLAQGAAAGDGAAKDDKKPVVAEEKKDAAGGKKAEAAEKKDGAALPSGEKEAPEFIVFDKAKMGPVKFPHKVHGEMAGKCEVCHGGEAPLFPQKKTEGMLMKDMYAGKSCGACHDGKKAFKAMGGCPKCHKKDAK